MRFGRRSASRSKAGAIGLVAAVLTLAAAPVAAVGSTHAAAKSPLEQGKAFYAGKSITWIVGGTTGGGLQLYALALQPYVQSYLHATVNIDTIPAGGGVSGADEGAAATPNGLTVAFLQTSYGEQTALTGTPYVNFNEGRLAWIETEKASPQVLTATTSSGLSSASQLVNNQTGLKEVTVNPGASGWVIARALFHLLNTNVTYVTGYPSSQTLLQGFDRGDGQLSLFNTSLYEPLISGNQAKGLLVTYGNVPVGFGYRSYINSTPTITQVLNKYPPKSKQDKAEASAVESFAAAPGTLIALQTGASADKVDAMRAAVKFALSQPSVTSSLLADGQIPTYSDPVTAKTNFVNDLKAWKSLTCFAGSGQTTAGCL